MKRIILAAAAALVACSSDNSKLTLNPAGTVSTTPRGTINFSATGFTGVTFSLKTNASGGTITPAGVYTAGSTGSVTDVVQGSASGHTATVNVNVGPGVSIEPAGSSTFPGGTIAFTASGGSGTGFVWALATGGSGGTISDAGAYKAGPTANTTDTVNVTDSLGNTASTTVTVGAGVAITGAPATVAPRQPLTLGATGGSGTGYSFALSANPSGGTVSTAGAYVAGATPNTTDTVVVTDSAGNTAQADITVGAGVSISPTSTSVAFGGTATFTASGGGGTYTYTIPVNHSGGTIDSSGHYQAGAAGSVTDTVQAADQYGNTATATVTVGPPPLRVGGIPATDPATPPKGVITLTASGGSGTGYVFGFVDPNGNQSGGTIDGNTYTAGATGDVTDEVFVKDSLDAVATATIKVGPAITITPAEADVPQDGHTTFSAAGGSGTGFVWTIAEVDNQSGGAIDAASGAYDAGDNPSVDDTITVTDSLNNTATAVAHVGPPLKVVQCPTFNAPTRTAAICTLDNAPPKGTVQLTATGGTGTGYTWTLTGDSFGTIDANGLYHAGSQPNVQDGVQVQDSFGHTATGTVYTGPGITISGIPGTSPAVQAGGTLSLTASGGSGSGFAWSIATDNSGGASIDPDTGAYHAGAGGLDGFATDTVSVMDSLGNTASADISVGPVLLIVQDGATFAPNQTTLLTTSGGSGTVSTWEITSGDATIDADGTLHMGATGNADVGVKATDSNNNVATATVHSSAALSATPTSVSVAPYGTATITPTGGLAPYSFSVTGDGAILTDETHTHGGFTAGPGVAGVDELGGEIQVKDATNAVFLIPFTVTAGLQLQPTTDSVHHSTTHTYTAVGGVPPYTFDSTGITSSGTATPSGSSIGYVAGPGAVGTPFTDVITVTDSNPNHVTTASTTITVAALACTSTDSSTCAPATPYCDVNTPDGACVECLTDANCGSQSKCSADACVPLDLATVASQISAVRNSAAGAVNLPISDAVVTFIKPTTGTAANADIAGFFVQVPSAVEPNPGLFVASTDPVAIGDRVSLTVTTTATMYASVRYASAYTGLTILSHGHPIDFVQTGSSLADLASNLGNYDSEVMNFNDVTITSGFAASGSAHSAASADTAALTGNPNVKVRFPDTLITSLGLGSGCHVTMTNVPLWAFSTQAQMMSWTAANISVGSCPAPTVSVSPNDTATGVSQSSNLVLTFSRPVDGSTLTAQSAIGPCTGSVQVSSDGFATCMGFGAPALTALNTTATFTPVASYPYLTNWKVKVFASVAAVGGGTLGSDVVQGTGFTIGGGPSSSCNAATPPTLNGALVISQVYGGGGNSGATYKNDFVELHNRGNTSITIPASTYSVQYNSATSTTTSWLVTTLPAMTIAPGGFVLVGESGGSTGSALPTTDAPTSGTFGTINLSATNGKVLLASTTTAFAVQCPSGAGVIDLVGYGTSNCFQGSAAAPAGTNSTALQRSGSCTSTGQNSTDLSAVTPLAHNSASANNNICSCGVDVANNETGVAAEADYCALLQSDGTTVGASNFSVPTGATTPAIQAEHYEGGLTPYGSQPASVIAQVGYGPVNANPESQSGWTWIPAGFVSAGGSNVNNDKYSQTFTAPAAGTYWYTYRFSLDTGSSWTYCDSDGAGSNNGLQFDLSKLPTMTITTGP